MSTKEQRREYNKRYYEKHRERLLQDKREKFKSNPEFKKECYEYHAKWQKKNKEKLNEYQRQRRLANKPDVLEVRHGEWEWFEDWLPSTTEHPRELNECGWRCGNCGTALADLVGGYWDDVEEKPKLNFCPDCGAKMDGERSKNVDKSKNDK